MAVEANVAVVRRPHDLLRRYDDATADEIWTEDIVFREPQQVLRGRAAGKARFGAFRGALPDIEATLQEVVAQDDEVAVRYTLTGTHEGPFAGVEATGKRVTRSGLASFRVADGRLAEGWGCADTLGLLQHLGALPAPGRRGGELCAPPHGHAQVFPALELRSLGRLSLALSLDSSGGTSPPAPRRRAEPGAALCPAAQPTPRCSVLSSGATLLQSEATPHTLWRPT
jgi:steroid delta-isomerase-like uncharacterized protein